jgi:hypothetical protein
MVKRRPRRDLVVEVVIVVMPESETMPCKERIRRSKGSRRVWKLSISTSETQANNINTVMNVVANLSKRVKSDQMSEISALVDNCSSSV